MKYLKDGVVTFGLVVVIGALLVLTGVTTFAIAVAPTVALVLLAGAQPWVFVIGPLVGGVLFFSALSFIADVINAIDEKRERELDREFVHKNTC